MKLACLLLICSILFLPVFSTAQKNSSFKFNKITTGNFSEKIYSIDSNASAVILGDVGETSFIGNKKGWFTLVFKRHLRVRILKSAAKDIATFRIVLYKKDKNEESLEDVNASTFNENNGSVAESVLDKKDIFQEDLDKNHIEKKFTMPAVKEGSIIDVQYVINSDYTFNLQPWTFQHIAYPCLWSEYEINVPELLSYVSLKQGYHKYFIEEKKIKQQVYRVIEPPDISAIGGKPQELVVNANNIKFHWAMKDLPGFNVVDYITSPENYLDKIVFQLSQISDGENVKDVMNSWPKATEELAKDEFFGGALMENNFWLDKDVQDVCKDISDPLEASKKIYEFVKKGYTCTGEGYLIKTKLFDVFKNKKGNAGEINLLLINMLRKKGIAAEPVLVSTRSNGRPYDKYPMLSKYNYAFCRATIANQFYYLDAAHPFLGFGRLDPECYNGNARVINFSAESIGLVADSLKESKVTEVAVRYSGDGVFKGIVSKTPGYYESYAIREKLTKDGKDGFYNDIKKSFPEAQINNLRLDSLYDLDETLGVHYDFEIKQDAGNTIYLNPLFGEKYEKNLFKSEDRLLPVEMDFPANRTYSMELDIPKGYVTDELPSSLRVKLSNDGDEFYEYIIRKYETRISLQTRLVIKRTYFSAFDYNMLREFFDLIVKKQNENIVFKKKN
jgi:hypothetical protein